MAVTSVNDFLLENVGSPVEKRELRLKRFKTPWTIKSLTAEETSELRKLATKRELNKRTHQYEQATDQNKFADSVLTAAVVVPDLNNAELQKSWGCIGEPEKLLKRMLSMGEYTELSNAVMDLSGLNDDDSNDLVDTAKN